MKNLFKLFVLVTSLTVLGSWGGNAVAATITSTATGGNWATTTTWVGGVVPATGDSVIIATTGANSVIIGAAVTQTAAGSVAVNSGATLTATAANVTFGALTINSGGTFTTSRVLTVLGATNITGTINFQTTVRADVFAGDVTLNAGAVWNETVAITPSFGGSLINNAATFTTLAGQHTFNGTAAQTLGGSTATTFINLTINNTSGGVTITSASAALSPTVTGTLTLTNGLVFTTIGTNDIGIGTAGTISGGSAASYVVGSLQKNYLTGAALSYSAGNDFPVGDASNYTPVNISAGTTTTAGSLTISTLTPDHPSIASSGIDPNNDVNRYWRFNNSGLTIGTAITATFTFVPGDLDPTAVTSNFVVQRYFGTTWNPTTLGTDTGTTSQASGITLGTGNNDFAVGDPPSIGGTVFEDINYGGGAGRSLSASGGVGISGARVELYNAGGAFVSATTTNTAGAYQFSNPVNGTYTVRVASNGVTGVRSTRAVCTTCVPVQTYRTDASSGAAMTVTDHVGGENPTLVDAADNTTSATLASLTTGTTTAESIATVTKSGASVSGVDFGFNFDTIVSVRDAGQGSLRQFIINANGLGGGAALAQSGLTAGLETSVFMISDGALHPGLHGSANQLTGAGANAGTAVISLASALPAISGANVSLDGTTQTTNVGDTNSGTVGTGGTVGVAAVALPQFNRPEVVIAAAATQLSGTGSPVYIKGLAVSNGGIIVSGASSVVQDCLAGMDANGTVTTIYSAAYGITAGTGTGILIHHNYVKVNDSGIRGDSPGANLTIEYNEVDSPLGTPGGGHTNTFDGILVITSATNVTVQYNLVKNQEGGGLEYGFGTGAVTGLAQNNTIMNNGYTGAAPSTEGMGVAFYSLAAGTAITFKQNIVTGNSKVGIAVIPGATALTASGIIMTQNSIYSNGSIGIDLNPISSDPNTYTVQGVTVNDLNDADTGPNGLLNFPILATATISGGNLVLTGWARPGSAIELFIAVPDPTNSFGEGKTYLTTLTEGSAADTDATSSTYGPAAINGLLQGTDNTNRFNFTIALPAGVNNGTTLTSTATLGSATSEFSGNVVVGAPNPSITLLKTVAVYSDPVNLQVNPKNIPGAIAQYTVIASNSGGPADYNSTVITDPIPANTALYVNNIGGTPAGPVSFTNGATPSGLTLVATNISFSNSGSAGPWTYTPVPGADGCDPAVTHLRVNPQGTFVGSPTAPNPSFQLTFRVCVK